MPPCPRCISKDEPCGYCQRKIDELEDRKSWPDPEGVEADERFYEKYLDRIGGSRD